MSENENLNLDEIGHPRGTLAIVALYALLFVAGWIFLFATQFVPRGTPQPGIDAAAAVCETTPESVSE